MKKLFLTLIVAFATICGFAQEIKSVDTKFEDYQLVATFDDCLSLLQQAGYNMFVYDISTLKDKATFVEFSVREYVNGNLVDEEHSHQHKAKLIYRISEFSEDDQKVIKAAAIADDEDNDIFRLATRLKIGFTPVGADMEQSAQFEVAGKVQMALFSKLLSLRDNRVDKSHRKLDYYTRPFIIDGFEKGKFIPLLMYGSAWWDADCGYYRFCGDSELSPDMTSELLKDSPHYFVIGVKFE